MTEPETLPPTELTDAKLALLHRMEKECYRHPKNLALNDDAVDQWRQSMAGALDALDRQLKAGGDPWMTLDTERLPAHLMQPLLRAAESMNDQFHAKPVVRSYENPRYVEVSRDFLQCAFAIADQYSSLPERLRNSAIQSQRSILSYCNGAAAPVVGSLYVASTQALALLTQGKLTSEATWAMVDDAMRAHFIAGNAQITSAAEGLLAPVDWTKRFDESLQTLAAETRQSKSAHIT